MRKFKRLRRRALPFRLLLVVAGALLLAGAFVPRTHAAPIAYWNFEDGGVENGPVNLISDAPGILGWVLVPFGINPYTFPDMRNAAPGLNLGLAPGDPGPSMLGMGLSGSGGHSPTEFRFALPNAGYLQQHDHELRDQSHWKRLRSCIASLQHYWNSRTVHHFPHPGPSGWPHRYVVTAAVPAAANNAPNLAFSIILSGGQSNGNNVQNTIDNILIDGTIVPEPATIAGGLLGVLGLGWQQRRRLIGALRFRRT